ncbi:uncharacterized protein LOC134166773 isoform X1 [Pezoporus occidentalis]|uniref:uncharacterized protein LOC134166773 isoform X1 n=1 Tax=Pezoporus occidentalis TaxID=407982 RepID=UPI002F916028
MSGMDAETPCLSWAGVCSQLQAEVPPQLQAEVSPLPSRHSWQRCFIQLCPDNTCPAPSSALLLLPLHCQAVLAVPGSVEALPRLAAEGRAGLGLTQLFLSPFPMHRPPEGVQGARVTQLPRIRLLLKELSGRHAGTTLDAGSLEKLLQRQAKAGARQLPLPGPSGSEGRCGHVDGECGEDRGRMALLSCSCRRARVLRWGCRCPSCRTRPSPSLCGRRELSTGAPHSQMMLPLSCPRW